MPALTPIATTQSAADRATTDPVALSWLVTVRWTTLAAGIGAMLAGGSALETSAPVRTAVVLVAAAAASNVWLMWRIRAGRSTAAVRAAGLLVCADTLLLSWLLLRSGGVLNPASVFYLVLIVVAALVLGRTWTWIVAGLSIAGYAALFLTQPTELRAAQVMHPEIALHMRGMWLAFALTALIIAILVARFVIAVERRDQALEILRDRTARAARFAGLTTLAAGAAHELSTPLATMAVAARELERALEFRPDEGALRDDARLIRAEIDRCRRILNDMAGRVGEPVGQAPTASRISAVMDAVLERLRADVRRRVHLTLDADGQVLWPMGVVVPAIANLVTNALQASAADGSVTLVVSRTSRGAVRIVVADRGRGMSGAELARAGEPFFTTKSAGGTGLGLFVARSTIEQLGGTLHLASSPGQGTTATAVLPADAVTLGTRTHE